MVEMEVGYCDLPRRKIEFHFSFKLSNLCGRAISSVKRLQHYCFFLHYLSVIICFIDVLGFVDMSVCVCVCACVCVCVCERVRAHEYEFVCMHVTVQYVVQWHHSAHPVCVHLRTICMPPKDLEMHIEESGGLRHGIFTR